MSEKKRGSGWLIFFSLLLLFGGAALAIVAFFTKKLAGFTTIGKWGGIIVAVLGLILLFVGLKRRKGNDSNEKGEEGKKEGAVDEPPVRYIPSENVYQFVNMGDRQSIEEKFNEIQKMDKTQFVIYVARLFSRNGYQVKFTPILNNYNIDLLVEKMGVTIAVGCILSKKVLCANDIRCVVEGSRYYHVNNVMTLTNMYFDRTAIDYAKRERMSLVDRNILAEDFMTGR